MFDEAHDIDDASEVPSVASTPLPPSSHARRPQGLRNHAMDRGDTPPEISGDELGEDEHFGGDRFADDHSASLATSESDDDGRTPGPDEDEDDDDAAAEFSALPEPRKLEVHMDGAYDPADYADLPVSADIRELFNYIRQYKPDVQSLETRLRPFVPDYIPAVGDIDAMIKVERPDGKPTGLGTEVLDEPSLGQSDPNVFDLQLRATSKVATAKPVSVRRLEARAPNRLRAIDKWVAEITAMHRDKPPQNVQYKGRMPDVDTLMQEWPPQVEQLLAQVELPGADLDVSLKEYASIVCALVDIPVHKHRVESLHLLFTLLLEFKNSQHFRGRAAGGGDADGDAPE